MAAICACIKFLSLPVRKRNVAVRHSPLDFNSIQIGLLELSYVGSCRCWQPPTGKMFLNGRHFLTFSCSVETGPLEVRPQRHSPFRLARHGRSNGTGRPELFRHGHRPHGQVGQLVEPRHPRSGRVRYSRLLEH